MRGDQRFIVRRLAVRTIRYKPAPDVVLTAFLSDRLDGTGETYTFQRALHGFDEQDRELGMDTYCLTDSFGATCYGCIIRYHFDGTALTLFLNEEAKRSFGPEVIRFELQVPGQSVAILRKALPRLFPEVLHSVPAADKRPPAKRRRR